MAASAFFTHQGHQVFHDPCLDLVAYCKDWRVMATIIDVDWLPDHVLSAGLDLLDTPSPPSDADTLGTSFMAAYLLAPAPAAPLGLISPSPMGGNLEGRTLSINRHEGTGGSVHSFHSAPPPFLASSVPSHSTRLVGALSHPPVSQGGRPCPDPKPDVQASSLVRSLGSSRFLSLFGYGGSTAVGVAGHLHRLRPPLANHLPIPRFYGGGLTLQTCPIVCLPRVDQCKYSRALVSVCHSLFD